MKIKDVIKVINDFHEKFEKCIECDAWRYNDEIGVYTCSLQKGLPCIYGGERVDKKTV